MNTFLHDKIKGKNTTKGLIVYGRNYPCYTIDINENPYYFSITVYFKPTHRSWGTNWANINRSGKFFHLIQYIDANDLIKIDRLTETKERVITLYNSPG